MPQPQHLVDVDPIVERERRRLGFVQHLDRRARRTSTSPVGSSVFTVPSGRGAHVALHAHHPFAAQAVRDLEAGEAGVDDHLHEARDVAHVEEHLAAVVATVRHPPAHDDGLADVGRRASRPPGAIASCRGLVLSRRAARPRFFAAHVELARRSRRSFTATMPSAHPLRRGSSRSTPRPTCRRPRSASSARARRRRDRPRQPDSRSSCSRHAGVDRADGVDDEHVDAGRRAPAARLRLRTRAAGARSRCRSRSRASAARPSPRPAGRSGRRRRRAFWAASSASLWNSNTVPV